MNVTKANIIAVKRIDFQNEQGELIKGTKFFVTREAYHYENGWGSQLALESIFVNDSGNVKVKGNIKDLPVACTLVYESEGRRNILTEINIE